MHKQEALDVLEAYRRNMEHILGDRDEQVQAIKTCITLVDELEDVKGYWQDVGVETNEFIERWQRAKCSECGLYTVMPYKYSMSLSDFCPHCGADMLSK